MINISNIEKNVGKSAKLDRDFHKQILRDSPNNPCKKLFEQREAIKELSKKCDAIANCSDNVALSQEEQELFKEVMNEIDNVESHDDLQFLFQQQVKKQK